MASPAADVSFTSALREALECCVCLEEMVRVRVFTCPNGHAVCGRCQPLLLRCPQCRHRRVDVRCRALERVADIIPRRRSSETSRGRGEAVRKCGGPRVLAGGNGASVRGGVGNGVGTSGCSNNSNSNSNSNSKGRSSGPSNTNGGSSRAHPVHIANQIPPVRENGVTHSTKDCQRLSANNYNPTNSACSDIELDSVETILVCALSVLALFALYVMFFMNMC